MGLRRCIVCGERYEFCPHCGSTKKEETWRSIYHDENCMDISMTMRKFRGMEITEEEAKRLINKYPENLAAIFDNNKSVLAQEIRDLFHFEEKKDTSIELPVEETVELKEEDVKVEEKEEAEKPVEAPKAAESKKPASPNKSTKYSNNKNNKK